MLMFGMRLGSNPRIVVTTTPRPTKLIRDLLTDPTVAVTRGTTYDNRANLPPTFIHQIIRKYEGTRLGRQELNAELPRMSRCLMDAGVDRSHAHRCLQPPNSRVSW
jgi:phage terminase large subunit-like protein